MGNYQQRNLQMGDCADDADRWAELQDLRAEFRDLLVRSSKTNVEYTQKDFPKVPLYVIHQNNLMNSGLSLQQRMEICLARYYINVDAKVGELIKCPCCNLEFKKKTYQQKFCGVKKRGRSNCKDFFFNFTDLKRNNRAKFFIVG